MDRRTFLTRSTATAAALGLAATGCVTPDDPDPVAPTTTRRALPTTTRIREMAGTTTTTAPEPPDPIQYPETVEGFFARLTEAIDNREDVRIDGPDAIGKVKELADRLEAAGWGVDRSDIVTLTHPDTIRYFRLVP